MMTQVSIKKINSIEFLNAIRYHVRKKNSQRIFAVDETIRICMGGGCIAAGSVSVRDAIKAAVRESGFQNKAVIVETGCMGPCSGGPVVRLERAGVFYQNVQPEDAREIIRWYIGGQNMTGRLQGVGNPSLSDKITDMNFFRKQSRVVLRNCGSIDPLSIEDYIAAEGYQALAKVVWSMTPEDVIAEIRKSGLRGRWAEGESVWRKWSAARRSPGDVKYVLCNADEGDPGAFADRSILAGDPHNLIEGMAIGAYAIGAGQGCVYVRGDNPLAVDRLGKAISRARECGLLGRNILGTDFSFDLHFQTGPETLASGEETALIASMEGRRSEPFSGPCFPDPEDIRNSPVVLNDVETFANIAPIILRGRGGLTVFGAEKSKGTKIFALTGDIVRSGLVEVPIGTALSELVYDIGGGIPGGKRFKAAHIGGPSGGCIPGEHLQIPLDYEPLHELGAAMGTGGVIVMDEHTCMVDVARYFIEYVRGHACGKCAPCRVGTRRLVEILTRICGGRGKESDIVLLTELSHQIKATALCHMGRTAPNSVLSTIRYFRHEYESHIRKKYCEVGVCSRRVRSL